MSREDFFARLELLVEACGKGVKMTPRGRIWSGDEALECREIGPNGGEWIELGLSPARARLRFAGWVEEIELGSKDEREDALDSMLDFVAAALFGELRIVEHHRAGRVLRRGLEVRVGGGWREHAHVGRLGLAGAFATLLGRTERRIRGNEGRVRRPKRMRKAGCSGLSRAPWTGAAGAVGGSGGAAEQLAIDGELDLHNFAPEQVPALVREYIQACRERGVCDLRIVHGKGKGTLRRTVHAVLEGHPEVESFRLGGHGEGSWGATIVRLL